jgi:tetratricopeptide (TPR) repeat protein
MILSLCFRHFLCIFFIFTLFHEFAAAQQRQDEDAQAAAIQFFEQGQNAHEKGDLETALKFYAKAVELNSEFPQAEFQRGAALQKLNRLSEAEKSFRRAIELSEDWSLAWAKLGALLVAEKKLVEAETVLNKAVALDAANFPALVALTELEINSQSAPEKLRQLLAKIRAQTDGKQNAPAVLWTSRAALERALGDAAAAKQSVRRALELQPDNVSARIERAEILLLERDVTAALADAKFAVTAAPADFQAQMLLARVYAANEQTEESLKILDALAAATAQNVNFSAVADLRKQILIAASGEKNVAALEDLLVKEPNNAAVLGKLCAVTRSANLQKALDYCRRAIKQEPQNITHFFDYGAALLRARHFDAATEVLQSALQIAPENYTARANLAAAFYEAQKYDEAIVEFNRLIDARAENAVAYYFLATAHDRIGNYVEAMAAYQKFLSLADPKQNQTEIDNVKFRLPILSRQIEKGARGKKKKP